MTDFSQYAEQDQRDSDRAETIARETGEFPLIRRDYRRIFALAASRAEAEMQCKKMIADRPPVAERRLGSLADQDIRQALDEAWPE
jgi:hypothetical protein